jgi:hypothetical protein
MPRSCEPLTRIARKGRSAAYAAIALFAALIVNAGLARADDTYSVLADITVPETADTSCASRSATLGAWDISWQDSLLGLYLLADRTNCAVEVFDSNTNTFLFRIGGFAGATSNHNTSGPDGVLTVNGRYVFAGDANSTVRILDLFSRSQIATVVTKASDTLRADEMAYDPFEHEIIVANDADTPPFVTFISTTPPYGILGQLSFPNACTTAINPTNCGGLEQSAYSSKTGLFYISVPIVGTGTTGEIAVINPVKRRIVGHFPVSCQPAGLAIGPNLEAMVGCSNGPVQIVSLKTGAMLASFPTLAGADEVWFNKGSRQYFVAANANTVKKGKKVVPAPVLGIVNADTHTLDQLIPTTAAAHSVAADANLNHIFLPNGATTSASYPSCTNGCATIFNVTGEDVASQ